MSTIAERIEELRTRYIGTEISYEGEDGRRVKTLTGIVKDVEFAGCSITNERGRFIGVRFLIKPKGKKPSWTWAVADEFGGAS